MENMAKGCKDKRMRGWMCEGLIEETPFEESNEAPSKLLWVVMSFVIRLGIYRSAISQVA